MCGIDIVVYEGVFLVGGKMVVVFGNGIDVVYLLENFVLYW